MEIPKQFKDKKPETLYRAHIYGASVETLQGWFDLSPKYVLVLHSWMGREPSPRKESKATGSEAYFKTEAQAWGWLVNQYMHKVRGLTVELQSANAKLEKLTNKFLEVSNV